MKAGNIRALRRLPPLTAASAAIYASSMVVLLMGLMTWQPEMNPRWFIVSLIATSFAAFTWVLCRGASFTMTEALVLIGLFLASTGAMTWHTGVDLAAFANGMGLPVIGVYVVWFLRWSTGRVVLYLGVAWWVLAIVQRGNPVLTAFALGQAVQTVIAAEVFAQIKTRMDRLVRTDPLTGVLNLRGVTESLEREMSRSVRRGTPLSVVSIDLDGLRALNNTMGHRAGDDLLQSVTEHWRQEVRSFDVIGRTGGDEFVLVLPETTKDVAAQVVERLTASSPGEWSAGIAEVAPDDTVESVLERADRRMYAEKATRQMG